jgi:hypothetical protein
MFFGGATSTAKEYKLKPWANREFLQLSETMTTDAFHSAIRQKYSVPIANDEADD